jgi:pimeloyl-ACP methyl ester carboxylesterase
MKNKVPPWVVALALAALLAGCKPGPDARHSSCDSNPVLFVHGFDQQPGIFDSLIAALERHGYAAACLHAIELKPARGSNQQAAQAMIAPYVDEMLESSPTGRVHLVGHSMGALSARWYATKIRPERVATLVTTSGANHGSDWECDDPHSSGHREMCPAFRDETSLRGWLQVELNGTPRAPRDETPFGPGQDATNISSVRPDATRSILYMTLRVPNDPYIVPPASLVLDGAGDPSLTLPAVTGVEQTSPGNFLLPGGGGHDEMLEAPETAELLYRILSARNGQLTGARD